MLKNIRSTPSIASATSCATGQIADDDLGADFAKCVGPVVVAVHHRADVFAVVEEQLDDPAADAADAAAGAGDQIHG